MRGTGDPFYCREGATDRTGVKRRVVPAMITS